jgi:transcriptional regulator with GAF, ATPase, and Fis domain
MKRKGTVVIQPDREQRVSEAFVALADTLVDDYDIIDLLDQLVEHSVKLLAADAAGIMLADLREQLHPVAVSSEDAETMELLQLQSDEGPCLEAYRGAVQVRIPDLSQAADRWPKFVAAVAGSGAFASVHAIPLRLRGQAIGALNLFHREVGALPDADLALGQALADVATIGILQERAIRRGEVLNEQLQTALHSRVIIEQAKGVVAQHLGVGMDTAFDRLRRYCRANNLRLAEVARQLVDRELDLAVLDSTPVRRSRRRSP